MIVSVCLKFCLLYFVVGLAFTSDVHVDSETKNQPPVPPVLSENLSGNLGGSTKINEISNSINSDGSFKFATFQPDVTIEIFGELKEVNGTKALHLKGTYNFHSFAVTFEANESGFVVEPLISHRAPLPRLLATITG